MCFYHDGYNEFQDSRVVKARKRHLCTACGKPIAAGEKYHRESGKFDDYFFVNKVCRRCDYDRFRIVEHELAEGCSWSESWPAISELVDHLIESGLGQTPPGNVPAGYEVGTVPGRAAP